VAASNSGSAVDGGEGMIVIGIGSTSRVTVDNVLDVIAAASRKIEAAAASPASLIATLDRPAINRVLQEAAATAGLEIAFLPIERLRLVAGGCVTCSEKSMKQYGIPSIAEAAALAATGTNAKLLVPRFCGRNITAGIASS
jgi:cobalamin biosynthesis protein CbiG